LNFQGVAAPTNEFIAFSDIPIFISCDKDIVDNTANINTIIFFLILISSYFHPPPKLRGVLVKKIVAILLK
jgi:hypothetical protein